MPPVLGPQSRAPKPMTVGREGALCASLSSQHIPCCCWAFLKTCFSEFPDLGHLVML